MCEQNEEKRRTLTSAGHTAVVLSVHGTPTFNTNRLVPFRGVTSALSNAPIVYLAQKANDVFVLPDLDSRHSKVLGAAVVEVVLKPRVARSNSSQCLLGVIQSSCKLVFRERAFSVAPHSRRIRVGNIARLPERGSIREEAMSKKDGKARYFHADYL